MKKGFSLVELMVVIAIVAILIAVVAPHFKTYVINARIVKAVNILQYLNGRLHEQFDKGDLGASFNVGGVTLSNGVNVAYDASPVKRAVYYANGVGGIPASNLFVCVYIEGLEGMAPSSGSDYVAPTTSVTGARNRLCIYNIPNGDVVERYCGIWTSVAASGGNLYLPPEYLPANCNCTALNSGTC